MGLYLSDRRCSNDRVERSLPIISPSIILYTYRYRYIVVARTDSADSPRQKRHCSSLALRPSRFEFRPRCSKYGNSRISIYLVIVIRRSADLRDRNEFVQSPGRPSVRGLEANAASPKHPASTGAKPFFTKSQNFSYLPSCFLHYDIHKIEKHEKLFTLLLLRFYVNNIDEYKKE